MTTKEMKQKADFIQEEYTTLAKKLNQDIDYLDYVNDINFGEEYLIVFYKNGYKKILCITANSLKAIVLDTVMKL